MHKSIPIITGEHNSLSDDSTSEGEQPPSSDSVTTNPVVVTPPAFEGEDSESDDEMPVLNEGDDSESEEEIPAPRKSTRLKIPIFRSQTWDLSSKRKSKTNENALLLLSTHEPKSLKEALESTEASSWQQAMDVEIKQLQKNHTYELVDPPLHRKVVGCKWVFKTKLNHDGSIERHKARLVAKGFTQKKGFDYYETYAPVARMASIRIIAAIATNNGWKLLQIDITSAYLNGKIDCDIYMSQPPGYIDENNPSKVWLLLKSLYGLKQAGKIWNGVLVAFLLENGFIQSLSDICIFIRIDENGYIILGVYVDDLQYAGNESATIKFLAQVTATFEMHDLGEAKLILRVQVDQDKSGIQLHQATYI